MKEIKAIVQHHMADKVVDGLRELPHLPGVTVSTVSGFSRRDTGVGPAGRVEEAKMTKIEIVVSDEVADAVVDAIARAAHTGRGGDGKIFVYEVSDVVSIRTGEHGDAAI
jgi:nitrogen regulatory protein P-II 1